MPSGISNLTSSIRGATGNEKIKNLKAIEAQTASIAGVVMNSTSLIAGKSILVGGNDATKGIITIYGGTTRHGGEQRFHTAADSDGTIEYYAVKTFDDELWIGPSDGPASLLVLNNNDIVQTPAGLLYVGTQDQQNGTVQIYGSGTEISGGQLKLIVSNAWDDGGVDQYIINVSRQNLQIGNNNDQNSLMLLGSTNRWNFTNPAGVEFGVASSTKGLINVHGNSTTGGGRINLHTGANADATINQYVVKANNDDLEIGPSTNETALMYRGVDNTWQVNAPMDIASVIIVGRGTGYINMNASAGFTGYGIRDKNGVMEFKNSNGTWAAIS